MPQNNEIAERLAVIETTLNHIQEGLEKHIKDDATVQGSVDAKLDELLALKSKGLGAFWAASIIFGAAVSLFVAIVKGWFVG